MGIGTKQCLHQSSTSSCQRCGEVVGTIQRPKQVPKQKEGAHISKQIDEFKKSLSELFDIIFIILLYYFVSIKSLFFTTLL